jgi:hypothetical protein
VDNAHSPYARPIKTTAKATATRNIHGTHGIIFFKLPGSVDILISF